MVIDIMLINATMVPARFCVLKKGYATPVTFTSMCSVHQLTVPRTTAPVYLKGSLAANPKTVLWYTPFATAENTGL